MREVYHDQHAELERLTRDLAVLLTTELEELNSQARALGLPHVIVPARK